MCSNSDACPILSAYEKCIKTEVSLNLSTHQHSIKTKSSKNDINYSNVQCGVEVSTHFYSMKDYLTNI